MNFELYPLGGGHAATPEGEGLLARLGERIAATDDPRAWRQAILEASAAWERTLEGSGRRRALGAYYTPDALADRLLATCRDARTAGRVIDPACGTGSLLAAVVRARRAGGVSGRALLEGLVGIDVDPVALALARARLHAEADLPVTATTVTDLPRSSPCLPDLPRMRDAPALLLASALEPAVGEGWAQHFDLVVGNPPFGSPLHEDTRRTDAERDDLRRAFPHAARGTFDRSGCFLELGVRLARPECEVAMIVPSALLSAPYAAALRAHCERASEELVFTEVEDASCFADAQVRVTGITLRVRRPGARRAPRSRPTWALRARGVEPWSECTPATRMGEAVLLSASATVDEGYRWRDLLVEAEQADPPVAWTRMVTTGAIDAFGHGWGTRVQRHLGGRWHRPVLPRDALPERRRAMLDEPRVLVAGLSRVVEAVRDERGLYAGTVGTMTLRRPPGATWSMRRLEAMLNSLPFRALYRAQFRGQALGGGSIPITRASLAAFDVPDLWFAPERQTDASTAPAPLPDFFAVELPTPDLELPDAPFDPTPWLAAAAALRRDHDPATLQAWLDREELDAMPTSTRGAFASCVLLALVPDAAADRMLPTER